MKKLLVFVVLSYLRFFARMALKKHHPVIIGIAGSVGKSSTRNAVYALLKEYFPANMVYGNSETGIPLGILGITQHGFSFSQWFSSLSKAPFGLSYLKHTKYLIVEMGIDEPFPPKNMTYLLTIVKPDIAISLNASATHTLQFEKILGTHQTFASPEEKRNFLIQKIADEDTKLISEGHPKLAIVNADNEFINHSLAAYEATEPKTQFQRFGKDKTNTISSQTYTVTTSGTTFVYQFHDDPEKLTLTFPTYILPREYEEVFAPTILVGKYLGLSYTQIQQALEKNYELPKGRATLLHGINNSLLIDSSYNASKDAVIAFLELVKKLKTEIKKKVVFVFADMRELGDESAIEHTEIAALLKGTVDFLYLIGPQTKQFVLPVAQQEEKHFQEIAWFSTAVVAGEYLKKHLPADSLVLIKGSQNTLFLEETIKFILADKKDEKKLCRQEDFWLKKKAAYFGKQSNRELFEK